MAILTLIVVDQRIRFPLSFSHIIITDNMVEFRFPIDISEALREVANVAEIKDKLDEVVPELGKKVSFKYYERQNRYIYCYCTRCSARLRYQYNRQKERYVLQFSVLRHMHPYSARKQRNNLIMNYISQLPNSIDQKCAKQIVIREFNISEATFYYLYQKAVHPKISYHQLIQQLENHQCFIQSEPWAKGMNFLPDILVVVSPQMKAQFQLFGQWVYFDTTYNLIRQRREDGKQWKVGMMIGLNAAKKIIPFGYCIVLNETNESFYKVFHTFFEMVNGVPEAFITDESQAIKSALRQLKDNGEFTGVHLLDNFHLLRNIKKRLVEKDKFQYFVKLLKIQSTLKFKKLSSQFEEYFNDPKDMKLYKWFINESQAYCFSQVPAVLVGTSITDAPGEKTNDMLKSFIKIEKPFTTVALRTFTFLQNLIRQSSSEWPIQNKLVEDYYCFPQIKYLRLILAKPVFRELIGQIKQIYKLETETLQDNNWIITDSEGLKFEVIKQNSIWKCSCEYLSKTGIPCMHICKIVKTKGCHIEDCLHKRWKKESIAEAKQMEKQLRLGRGRDTRRNRS